MAFHRTCRGGSGVWPRHVFIDCVTWLPLGLAPHGLVQWVSMSLADLLKDIVDDIRFSLSALLVCPVLSRLMSWHGSNTN